MAAKKRNDDHRQPRSRVGCHGGPPPQPVDAPDVPVPQGDYNALIEQGMASTTACSRLRQLRKAETDDAIRRRRAHIDDLIRVFRNLTALALLSAGTLTVVAYAGIQIGIPPAACVAGSLSTAAVLVRSFTKTFESIRPLLPDAPKDLPSNDAP